MFFQSIQSLTQTKHSLSLALSLTNSNEILEIINEAKIESTY